MNTITTKDGTQIYFKDWGKGQPVVFSHGWPLSADDWDTQMLFFLRHGYRVIAHDRRGHGRSTQTGGGHGIPAGGERLVNAAWTYEAPYAAESAIREYLAFYSDRVDAIEVVED